jgi:hypothetical protein
MVISVSAKTPLIGFSQGIADSSCANRICSFASARFPARIAAIA